QPPLALLPDVGQPPIVRLADGNFDLRSIGDLLDEDRRVHHLDVDPIAVHVAHAGLDVQEVLRFWRDRHVATAGFAQGLEVFRLDDVADVAADPAVDQPELARGLGARIDQDRHVLALGGVAVLPGLGPFHDVGVGVDDGHDYTSENRLEARGP